LLSASRSPVGALVLVAGTAGASCCAGTIVGNMAVAVAEGDESDGLNADLLRLNIFIPLTNEVFTLGISSFRVAGGVAARLAARVGVAASDIGEDEARNCDGTATFLNLRSPEGKPRPRLCSSSGGVFPEQTQSVLHEEPA
jgi:hypothetical protein